jgi:hypothetical protein
VGRHARALARQLAEVDVEQREAQRDLDALTNQLSEFDLDDDPAEVDHTQVARDAAARAIERLTLRRSALEKRRAAAERDDLAELLAAAAPAMAREIEALAEIVQPLDGACETIERALAAHERLIQAIVLFRSVGARAHYAGLAMPQLPELPRLPTRRLIAAREATQQLAVVAASLDGGSIGGGVLGARTLDVLEALAKSEAPKEVAA